MKNSSSFSGLPSEGGGIIAASILPAPKTPRRTLLLSLMVLCLAGLLPGPSLLAQEAVAQPASFIPNTFEPPTLVETPTFIVKPLGPELVNVDYVAYMSSIEHLQKTFSRSTSWPHENVSMTDAMVDMQNEERRFNARESFAYAVLTPDEAIELGCVYVYPSTKPGFDAVIRLWVTQEQYDKGFDPILLAWTKQWINEAWPFENPAYPGRDIPWSAWD